MMAQLNKKRLAIRIALIVLIIALCFVLNYYGKQHDVYLDNMEATIGEKNYKGIAYMTLVIDGNTESEMEFYADDRDVVKLKGPSHTMKISVIDEDTEAVIKTVNYSMEFGTEKEVMLSLPAIVEGAREVSLPVPQDDTQYSDKGADENVDDTDGTTEGMESGTEENGANGTDSTQP